jgi:hypothetical protein
MTWRARTRSAAFSSLTPRRLDDDAGLGQAAVIDVVGEIEHDALGFHAERGGDELGVERVDQVRQAGAAQCPQGTPQRAYAAARKVETLEDVAALDVLREGNRRP